MNIKQYDCFEIKTDKSVTVVSPDGKSVKYAPFLKQNIRFEYDELGLESAVPEGEKYYAVRFYPDLCGNYTVIYDGGKRTELSVTKGENRGYIEVSKTNKRYLAYSDGTSFFPIGLNLCYPTPVYGANGNEFGKTGMSSYMGLREYERWFRDLSKNGGNMARIWLGHEYFCYDTENINEFDYVKLEKIDKLVELAEKYGIVLKLTLEQFRFFDYQTVADSDSYKDDVFRKFNKHLYAGNRRCEDRDEWLTDDIWKNAWLNKIKQLAYRLSGNPNVFAIELWNEMSCFESRYLVSWNREMLPKVKELFPHHLVINSYGSMDGEYAVRIYDNFCWECSDLKQLHRYLDQGAEFAVCHDSPIKLLRDGIEHLLDGKQPLLVAETGAVNNCHSGPFRYYSADHDGLIFADCVYTPAFAGCCGSGNMWHWNSAYVESKNLYHFFRPLADMVEGIDFQNEDFKTEIFEDDNITAQILNGKNVILLYVRNSEDTWQNLYRDVKCVNAVKSAEIPLKSVKSVNTYFPWDDSKCTVNAVDGGIIVGNLKHGVLIKVTK